MLNKTQIEAYQDTKAELIEQAKLVLALFAGVAEFANGFNGEFEKIVEIDIPRNDHDVVVVTKWRIKWKDCFSYYAFPQSYLYMSESALKLMRESLIENCNRKEEETMKSEDKCRKAAYWFKTRYGVASCSACGKSVFVGWNSSKKIKTMHETYKFCPFCGAEMKPQDEWEEVKTTDTTESKECYGDHFKCDECTLYEGKSSEWKRACKRQCEYNWEHRNHTTRPSHDDGNDWDIAGQYQTSY